MYSLNVPVPGGVRRLASELHPRLTAFDTIRDRHTLVAKRLGDDSLDRHRERLRLPLRDVSPFEARVTGIDFFERPTKGSSPVVYLTIESSGLFALHDRLCEEFGTIDGLEGDDYVPHVTLARGGTLEHAEALAALDIDPVTWTVSTLDLWSGKFRESAATLRLR